MIEHTESHGHLYGMSKSSFEECIESGGNVIKIMDRNGALSFKKIYPNEAVTIYLRPPSVEILAERLRGRGTESFAEYNRRMMNNINEMKSMAEYDYVVTASTPEATTKIVFAIIQAIANCG
jgi:guanylate kinase